jgi:hypothetical protein
MMLCKSIVGQGRASGGIDVFNATFPKVLASACLLLPPHTQRSLQIVASLSEPASAIAHATLSNRQQLLPQRTINKHSGQMQ